MTLSVRTFTLTAKGTKLGTFTDLDELGRAFVAHFGKGHAHLAGILVDALKTGKDTARIEHILGVRVTSEYAALAA